MPKRIQDVGKNSRSWIDTIDMDALDRLSEQPIGTSYSYNQMCELINIPKLTGNSKIKQLNELSCVCEYEKNNSKFTILGVREPDEILTYRKNSTYTTFVELIISQYFRDDTECEDIVDGILFITSKRLSFRCGFINENFMYATSGDNMMAKLYLIAKQNGWTINELLGFDNVSYMDVIKPTVRTAMRSLDNRKSITIQKGYKLIKKGAQNSNLSKCITATSNEGQQIEHIVAQVYTEMGIKTSKEMYLKFRRNRKMYEEYNKRCNELCHKILGWDYFIDSYAIVMNPARIKYNIESIKKEINKLIIDKIYRSKQMFQHKNINVAHFDELVDACINVDTEYDFFKDVKDYYEKP